MTNEIKSYPIKEYKVRNVINKNKNCDLSIIIPCYNVDNYIEKCLKSIINQKTKYSFEIICIDDGSTDNTAYILNKYKEKDKRIKIYHQGNSGISNSRNKALCYSNGEYISFVDSDDYLENNFIDVMLRQAKIKNADYVKCGYIKYIQKSDKTKKCKGKKIEYINKKLKNEILKINGYSWGAVIKKTIFQDIVFPPNYWFEDMIIRMLILRKCTSFIYIEEPLYYYRIREESATKKQGKGSNLQNIEQFYLVTKICEYSKEIQLEEDEILNKLIISELGQILYTRIRSLDRKYKKDIFDLSCEFWKSRKNTEEYQYSIIENLYIFSFKRNIYILWKCISIFISIIKKIKWKE